MRPTTASAVSFNVLGCTRDTDCVDIPVADRTSRACVAGRCVVSFVHCAAGFTCCGNGECCPVSPQIRAAHPGVPSYLRRCFKPTSLWAPVQIHASEFVRVCSYDRAGLERSDEPDHYPRTGAEVVAELHALLQAAGVQPPYLFVGHSYGALFSRLYAQTYPDEVAGLLWLDPWPLDYDQDLHALVTDQQWEDYQRQLAGDPDNEVIDFPATYEQIRAAGKLPDVPLLILSHGQPPTAESYRQAGRLSNRRRCGNGWSRTWRP